MATWDKAKPAGSSKIRDGDDSIRANWDALEDALSREHNFPGTYGDDAGVHTFTVGTEDGDVVNGAIMIVNDELRFCSGDAWRSASFPTGTKLPFFQATAPTGWTIDATHNDKVIRVNSTVGGGSGGSWTISGLANADCYCTVFNMPAHSHYINLAPAEYPSEATASMGSGGVAAYAGTSSNGWGTPHNHAISSTGAWRPAYIDVIVCTKD